MNYWEIAKTLARKQMANMNGFKTESILTLTLSEIFTSVEFIDPKVVNTLIEDLNLNEKEIECPQNIVQ